MADFEPTAEDLALFGEDRGKFDAFVNRVETDRLKARQSVIDQKDQELRSFKGLGLTPDEIKVLKDKGADAPDPAELEKRIRQSLENDLRGTSDVRLRGAEVRAQAAGMGFVKPQQALALVDQAELAKVKVGDDGTVDEAAVKKLLDDLAKDSPHLLAKKDTTVGHREAGVGASGAATAPVVAPGIGRLRNAYAESDKK